MSFCIFIQQGTGRTEHKYRHIAVMLQRLAVIYEDIRLH